MDFEDLEKRLTVVDGFIPKAAIMAALTAQQTFRQEARLWRILAQVFGGAAVVSLLFALGTSVHASSAQVELSVYRDRCLDIASAERVTAVSDASSAMAMRCMNLHEDNAEFYRVLMALRESGREAEDATNVGGPQCLEPLTLMSMWTEAGD